MALKRPISIYGGELEELRAGDSLPGSGAAAISEAEIDFGAAAVKSRTFTIVDAAVTLASRIIAVQSGKAATGRAADENEMDALILRANPGSGQFTLYADCLTGRVSGKFKINYSFQ